MKHRWIAFLAVTALAAGALAVSQTQPQRAKPDDPRTPTAPTIVAKPAKPAPLDAALERLKKSPAYARAEAVLARGGKGRIDLTLSVIPPATTGEACICAGGKGELNGKPTTWPCDCSPPGCGSCGSITAGD